MPKGKSPGRRVLGVEDEEVCKFYSVLLAKNVTKKAGPVLGRPFSLLDRQFSRARSYGIFRKGLGREVVIKGLRPADQFDSSILPQQQLFGT